MKTIYNVRALCLLAFLGSAALGNAQEDQSKDKNLNREMTLEREYDPSVQDASKVNTLPVVKEPEVRKIPIDYSNYTLAADPAKEISLLPSGNIMTQMDYNKRRGYFNFGIGNYMNINGDLGYHILSTEKDKLNVWYSHRSTNGKVKYIGSDEKVKAKLNDNLGGVNFQHAFDKLLLNLGAKYGYSGFNYYGRPFNAVSSMPGSEWMDDANRTKNQVNQTVQVKAGIESKEGASLGYLLDLQYINFSHRYGLNPEKDGPTEHTVEVAFDLNAGFGGNQRIGLGGSALLFNYGLKGMGMPTLDGEPLGDENAYYEFNNHAEVTLSPYYKIEGENWNVKLGANVMLVTGEDSKFMASPNISADIEVADKTVLYALATGKLYSNSMYEMSQVNRYLNPNKELLPSRNWVDATIGIKSGVAPGFWFDVFGGYKKTSDEVFFVPSPVMLGKGWFSSVSRSLQADADQLFAGVSLKYSYQQLIDLNVKGVYNHWKVETPEGFRSGTYKAYGKPEMEITAGITVRPIKNLSVALDYYLATGRYGLEEGLFDVKMKNINELNLTGTYTFNDTFGVYAKLNNILCQKYEVLYGYPLQSFGAMIGVNINF